MIYYFSGTGNSRRVARHLAVCLGEEAQSIDYTTAPPPAASEAEAVGLVFPVYAWGPPLVVKDFIKRWPKHGGGDTPYIYVVLTCGDDVGRTDRLVARLLREKNLRLAAAFSLQMRNTYVCLPGFNTDPDELVRQKDANIPVRLSHIAECVKNRRPSVATDLRPGAMPWLKSYVLRPLFNTWLVADKHFRCERLRCTGCGRCARLCPLSNITPRADGSPTWGGKCTHCLACYHGCTKHAIEYGFFTQGKGQVRIIP